MKRSPEYASAGKGRSFYFRQNRTFIGDTLELIFIFPLLVQERASNATNIQKTFLYTLGVKGFYA